MGKSFSKLKP